MNGPTSSRRLSIRLTLCLCVVLTFTQSACAAYKPVRMTVSGTRRQMGEQIGKAYSAQAKQAHAAVLDKLTRGNANAKAKLYAMAATVAKNIAAEDVEEMKGIAAGAGVPYEDVLFANTFYYIAMGNVGCRQLAVWGKRTVGGKLIHARNLDWPDYAGGPLRRNNLILNVKPAKGHEYLLLTWPGWAGALTGTNAKGVTLAFNMLPGTPVKRAAEPIFFTLRRVLRTCETVEKAIAELRRVKPLGNGSVMISDANAKAAVVVEVIDGVVTTRQPVAELIANANHATCGKSDKPDRDTSRDNAPAGDVASDAKAAMGPKEVQGVMGSFKVIQLINILSVVFVPADNKMYLACGRYRAAAGEFTEHVIFPPAKNAAAPAAPCGTVAALANAALPAAMVGEADPHLPLAGTR